jgi:hypothetical protein
VMEVRRNDRGDLKQRRKGLSSHRCIFSHYITGSGALGHPRVFINLVRSDQGRPPQISHKLTYPLLYPFQS